MKIKSRCQIEGNLIFTESNEKTEKIERWEGGREREIIGNRMGGKKCHQCIRNF